MLDALTGAMAGVQFRFATDHRELRDYGALHLDRMRAAPTTVPDVDAVLRWHEGPPPDRADDPALGLMLRVDRDVYLGPGRLSWFRVDDLRDLWLKFAWDGSRLKVEGDFYFRVGNQGVADRLRRLWQPAKVVEARRRRFTTLMYYMVYYPCWWWMEQVRQQHPIHAAGVESAAGTILLAGGSGVGKSTLAILLGAQPGARFLSDSFVLHRGRDVVPVREPVLVDAASRAWLGSSLDLLEPIPWRYLLGRSGFHFAADRLADAGEARVLFFPRRSPTPFVRAVSAEVAAGWLSAGDLIINDLRRYWAFAAVLDFLAPGSLMARREEALRVLTSQVPCYELGLSLDQSAADLIKSVDSVMAGLR